MASLGTSFALELQAGSETLIDTEHDRLTTSDTTNVLAASRQADEAVPDGGYGWVIVTGCAIMTFWFVGTTYR